MIQNNKAAFFVALPVLTLIVLVVFLHTTYKTLLYTRPIEIKIIHIHRHYDSLCAIDDNEWKDIETEDVS